MNNPHQNPQYRAPPQDQRYPQPGYQPYPGAGNQQPQSHTAQQMGVAGQGNQFSLPNSMSQNSKNTQSIHQQQFQNYANSNNTQYNMPVPQNQGVYFPPPQPAPIGLSSPPQLKQQMRDSVEQGQSDSNQNQVRQILWGQQQHNNTFWEQKFFMIYEKFQWFGQRFQMIKGEYFTLGQQLQTVDSEDDWNQLKNHHQEFAEKLEQMFQQLIAVADQNQQLIHQRLGEEGEGVWERRYHELLSNFKALQEKNNQLQIDNENMGAQHGNTAEEAQNYPELLSHYRALEQQYEKVINAYGKLQQQYQTIKASQMGPSIQDFENMRGQYQRNLQAIHNENDQLKTQCQGFYEQNQHLRQQLHSHVQSSQEADEILRVLQEKQSHLAQLSNELNEYKHQCQRLQDQNSQLAHREQHKVNQVHSIVQQREKELRTLKDDLKKVNQVHSIVQCREKQLKTLKDELRSKQSQMSALKKKLEDEVKGSQKTKSEHQDQISRVVRVQRQRLTRQRETVQKELKSVYQQFQALSREKNQKQVTKYQVQSLQKRIEHLKQENEQLSSQVKAKNQQLIAGRNVQIQLASYQNLLEQYKSLQKQKLAAEESTRKGQTEVLSLRKRFNQLEHQFTQYKTYSSLAASKSASGAQVKQLQQQLATQKQHALKVSSELHKYRQLVESKQSYIAELEQQSSKLLMRLQHHQKVNQGDKSDHKSQVVTLERRIQLLQKRSRINQIQFKKQITENYHKQILQLRQSNEEKLKRVKRLEQELQEIKTKSSHLERHSSTYQKEHQLLRKKIQSIQNTNAELIQNLQLSKSLINSLDQQLSSLKEKQQALRTTLNTYTIQMEQADNLIKNKNSIVVEYERQVNQFIQKVSTLQKRIDGQKKERNQKLKRYEEQIQKLKERLYSSNQDTNKNTNSQFGHKYSSSYSSNRYISFGGKQPASTEQRNEQILKLQNNLIEQMNEENSRLRNQLVETTKKLNEAQSLSRVVASMDSPSKSKLSNAPERDVGSLDIQQRLLKFNQRLQHCIKDNNLISDDGVDLTASQRIAYHQREKRQLQITYQKQIKALGDRIRGLQQQLASSGQAQRGKKFDNDIKQFDKYQIMNQQAQKTKQQEFQFLQTKLNEQTKTNSSLIKLNQQLKKQLQQYLQMGKHSTTEYYKMQWKQSEKNVFEEKKKSKKLADENKILKREKIEHDTKVVKEYQLKLFEMEMKLKQVQRQNAYLNINKTKGQNQRANLLHDVNVYSADLQALKSTMETRSSQYEKVVFQFRDRCSTLENYLQQLNEKLRKSGHSPSFGSHGYNAKIMA